MKLDNDIAFQGVQFAETSMLLTMATILSNFDITRPSGEPMVEVEFTPGFTRSVLSTLPISRLLTLTGCRAVTLNPSMSESPVDDSSIVKTLSAHAVAQHVSTVFLGWNSFYSHNNSPISIHTRSQFLVSYDSCF